MCQLRMIRSAFLTIAFVGFVFVGFVLEHPALGTGVAPQLSQQNEPRQVEMLLSDMRGMNRPSDGGIVQTQAA